MAIVKQALLFGDEESEAEVNAKSQSKSASTAKPNPPFPLTKPVNRPETAIAVKSVRRTNQKTSLTTEKPPTTTTATAKTRIVRTSRETFRITNGGMSRDITLWLEKRGKDHWEICGLPLRDRSEAGPYTSQDEAEGDKAGLRRFWEENGRYADWGA